MRRLLDQPSRPFVPPAAFRVLAGVCLLGLAFCRPAAAQTAPEPTRFPLAQPRPIVVALASHWEPLLPPPRMPSSTLASDPRHRGDPTDPAPLPPPPPHHTARAAAAAAGAGVVVFGVLMLLPEDITGWSAQDRSWEGLEDEWRDFRRHVGSLPVWDQDSWFFNYVGHPYVGMHTYLMERNYGMSPLRSFVFSTAASVVFEYGIEAWAEPPSAQDLLTTSPLGSILGELNYRLTQRLRKGGLTLPEKALVTVMNPIHVIQHGYR